MPTQVQQKADPDYAIPSVERAFQVLRYMGQGNRCRNLSKVSKELGINRTTLIRLIHSLLRLRMIEEIEEGAGYRLGPGLIGLAAQALHARSIVQVTQPILARLSEATGMSAHMGILDGRDIVYLAREAPNTHLVSNVRAGSRLPAHASSIGRAILAALEEEEVRALFSEAPLAPVTSKTPVTLASLLAQREQDRALGYAWSEGNYEAGIGSCAAAILDHEGRPAGALNVSGPQNRFAEDGADGPQRVRDAVLAAARAASADMGYGGD
jgi:DNA-binding IclR family transcriptional regulator